MSRQKEAVQLALRNLTVDYRQGGQYVTVLDNLSLDMHKGEIVALLGESGSGKTTIGKALTGLLPPSARIAGGSLSLESGEAIALSGSTSWENVRGREIGMLFQDARLALNPLMTVGHHFAESLRHHGLASGKAAAGIGAELLGKLGFERPMELLGRYPFELSGGMCQRVCLALTLALGPKVLVADEPTSALDAVSQVDVLNWLKKLQGELGLTILLITHDIAVANAASNRVIVLNKGEIQENGDTKTVLSRPKAAYTRSLLAARTLSAAQEQEASKADEEDASGLASSPLLSVAGLGKTFDRRVLHDVNFTLLKGEILGVLGHSGSGKSTLVRCLAGLEKPTSGQVLLRGEALGKLSGREGRRRSRQLQLVFQDARASLNPRRTALQLVQEPLRYLGIGTQRSREQTAARYLDEVGIIGDMQHRKPLQLSTGQCQRIAIARALAAEPDVLLCDEAVSALDMSVQAQILSLLQRLQKQFGFAMLMISHDIRVLRNFCDTIAVIDEGRISEMMPAKEIGHSKLPHTRRMLDCADALEAGL